MSVWRSRSKHSVAEAERFKLVAYSLQIAFSSSMTGTSSADGRCLVGEEMTRFMALLELPGYLPDGQRPSDIDIQFDSLLGQSSLAGVVAVGRVGIVSSREQVKSGRDRGSAFE
jgi:hypothetical protein